MTNIALCSYCLKRTCICRKCKRYFLTGDDRTWRLTLNGMQEIYFQCVRHEHGVYNVTQPWTKSGRGETASSTGRMKIHVLVLVSLVICLSLIETKSTGKDNKTDLSDTTGPKVNCKKEIVFFLSVLRICATYRRILSSESRVKNWAGLSKVIQTALYIADLNIPKGKLCSRCGCGSGKSGLKKGGPKKGGPKKDGYGNEDSAQQGDSDNDHEQRNYQDGDFRPDDNSSSYNNDKESGVFDEDASETIHGDGFMHEEESGAPDTADFIRALRRHLELSGRYRDERAAGRRKKRRPNPFRQLGHVCRYLSRLL